VVAAAAPVRALTAGELTAARSELELLPCPAAADPAQFAQLKSALDTLLAQQAAVKTGSQLPNQTKNTVADAQVVSDGGGGFTLTWTYKNVGDYGSNGEVGIADLTPLGSHLNKGESSPDWGSAQAADGDGNKLITLADLTPIGANLGAQVSGYKIYGSQTAGGPWTSLLGDVELAEATASFPRTFSFPLGAAPPPFLLLSAYDATGKDWQGGVELPPAQLSEGTVQPGSSAAIGTAGGTLDGPVGTPLEGVKVVIPAGAIPDGTQVTLDYNDGTVTPAAGVWEGPIIELHVDQPNAEFDAPLEITLPYSDSANYIPVPYYINGDGGFEGCDIKSIDAVNGTYTFYTWHASQFTTIKAAKEPPLLAEYSTKFKPEEDGFQVQNVTTPYSGGQCFGHTSFAAWYYRTIRRAAGSEPALYGSFMNDIGDGWKGQNAIASRCQLAYSRKREQYITVTSAQQSLTDTEVRYIIMNMLANTGSPVLLYVRANRPGGLHAHHSILAYAYDADELFVWDPNSPAPQMTPRITWDELFGDFNDFLNGGYNFNWIRYQGLGSYQVAESYTDIWQDAKLQFASADTTISNLNIADGHSTASLTQPLSFHVDSGLLLVEQVQLVIHHVENGTLEWLEGLPDGSDNYSFVIPLEPGDNEVWFDTKGFDGDNALVSSRNNLRGGVFNIVCTGTIPALRVEVTWDTSFGVEPGHIELAVQEPNGGAWLSTHEGSQTYPSGAELIAAGHESGGPQVYILESTDNVQFNQPYKLWTHFKPTTVWSEFTPVTMKIWINGAAPLQSNGTLLQYTDWNWNDGSEPEYVGPETQSTTLGWIGGTPVVLTAP
jgi:hypothetical protein